MTAGDETRIERKLHQFQLSMVKQIAELSGKLDGALAMKVTVDDHEMRLRDVESSIPEDGKKRLAAVERGSVSWRQLAALVTALGTAAGGLWWVASH